MPNTKKITQEFLFDQEEGQMFAGIAFSGGFLYLLDQTGNSVSKFNRCFEYIEEIRLDRNYSCICQGGEENSFWAASKDCPNMIFCLNDAFKEIGEVHILAPKNGGGYIIGLSYNCRCKTILVAYTWVVLEINPNTKETSIVYENYQGAINGVLSIYPGNIIVRTVAGKQSILLINQYQQITQHPLMTNYTLRQMVYCSYQEDPLIYCLMTQNSGRSKIVTTRISFKTLGFVIDSCYQEVCRTVEQAVSEKKGEYDICKVPPIDVLEVWEQFNSKHSNQGKDGCPKSQIMESVALSGAAISHILNAEGEKLQKVLACTNDISKIICVNKSVSQTIIHITHLEQVLYNKLLLLEDQCCSCCENRNCCSQHNRCVH